MTMEVDPSVSFKTLASTLKSNLLDLEHAWPYGSPFPPNILKDYVNIIRDTLVLFLARHHQLGVAAGQHEFAQIYDQFAAKYPTLNHALTKDMNFRNLARELLRICSDSVRPLSKPIAHLQLAHYPQLLGVYRARFFDTIANWVQRFSQCSPSQPSSSPITVYMNTPVLPNLFNPLPTPPSRHIVPEGRLNTLRRNPLPTSGGTLPPPVVPDGSSPPSRFYEIPTTRSPPNSNSPRGSPAMSIPIPIPSRAGQAFTTPPPPLEMDPRTVQRLTSLYDDLVHAAEQLEEGEGSTFGFAPVAEAFADALQSLFGPIQDRLSGEIRFWYDEFRMRDHHARTAPVELGTVARYDPAVDFYNRLRSLSILPEDEHVHVPSSPSQGPSFLTRAPIPILVQHDHDDTPPQRPASRYLRSTPHAYGASAQGPSNPNAGNTSRMPTDHFGNTAVGTDEYDDEQEQEPHRATTSSSQRDNDVDANTQAAASATARHRQLADRVRGMPTSGTARPGILRHTSTNSPARSYRITPHDVDTTTTGSTPIFQTAPTPAAPAPPDGGSVEAGNSNNHNNNNYNTGISSVPDANPSDVNPSRGCGAGGGGMGTDRDVRNPAAQAQHSHIRRRRNPHSRHSNSNVSGVGRSRNCRRRRGGGGGSNCCFCHCSDDGTSSEDESDPLSRPYVHREHQPDLFPPVVDFSISPYTIIPTSLPDPSQAHSLPFPAKIHPSLLHNPMGYLNPVGLRWNITQSPDSASFRTKFGMVIPIALNEDALLVDEGMNVNVFRGTSKHKIWVEADSQYGANSVLQWWMMDQRWGPIKIEKQTRITLRDVLLGIQDYFSAPLTLADYQTVVGSRTNTEYSNLDRLVAARRERGRRNDLMEVVMAEDIRYFGNFRRSDVLGTYLTFHGMRTEVRRDGTWVMALSLGPEVQRYY